MRKLEIEYFQCTFCACNQSTNFIVSWLLYELYAWTVTDFLGKIICSVKWSCFLWVSKRFFLGCQIFSGINLVTSETAAAGDAASQIFCNRRSVVKANQTFKNKSVKSFQKNSGFIGLSFHTFQKSVFFKVWVVQL